MSDTSNKFLQNQFNLENITPTTKNLVFGFIHESEAVLFSSSTHISNPYYHIPLLIIHLCMFYYDEKDTWDKELKTDEIFIDEETDSMRTIEKSKNRWHSVFGTKMCSTNSGIYHWKLLLTKVQPCTNYIRIMIGISPEEHWLRLKNEIGYPNRYMLCFFCSNLAVEEYGKVIHSSFGERFEKVDDTFEIIFDTNQSTIEYIVNGNSYGIAHKNIPKGVYKLAVSIREGRTLQLV